jgi:hypothetical protein
MIVAVAAFGLGYVLGSRAGRERYEQIIAAANKASQRLEISGGGGKRAARHPGHGLGGDSTIAD